MAEPIENGGWTPTYEWDMCKGGHPPQSVHENPDGRHECGRCGRQIDRTLCGCGTQGHEWLSRSFCPVMVHKDQMTVARAVRAAERDEG